MIKELPGYLKYFFILSSIVLTSYILILGQSVISPIVSAFIAALLLRPFSAKIEKIRISRIISSLLSILVVIAVISGISYFFSTQVNNIVNELTSIGARFNEIIDMIYGWMEKTFGVNQQEQIRYLKDSLNNFLSNSASAVTATITATAGFLTGFFLFLISLFFILYYRRFFVAFLYKIFPQDDHQKLGSTILKIENVVKSYILGLLTVIIIIAILNSVGLMILGIQHAIFFGVLAAILTVIPYIGIFIGSLLPILFSLVTKDSLWYPVGVALLFWIIQLVEGNFITPNVIGNKVSINPFVAIIALFLGGMFWGAIGMILAIPILAIIKVVCDAVESLQPIGFLLGAPPDENVFKSKPMHLGKLFKKMLESKRVPSAEAVKNALPEP